MRISSALTLTVAVLLVWAAPVLADPGAPGLDRPSSAVYLNSGEPPVLGEEGGPVGREGPVFGEEGNNVVPTTSLGGNGGGGDGGGGGNAQSLPFTGFSAALVLGAGLLALMLGLTGRVATARLRA